MKRGFTVLELLVVIAIIAMLVALIFAAMGPARDKGRQAVCFSNLRQISQAIQMYRQDYGGSDNPGHYFEMGLPPNVVVLARAGYLGAWTDRSRPPEVWICPSYRLAPPPTIDFGSYSYHVCDDTYGGIGEGKAVVRCPSGPEFKDFPEMVRIQGDEYPLVSDVNHNIGSLPSGRGEPRPPTFTITMRLNGRVHVRWIPGNAIAPWQY
jgi:prepilin-type N-terminal cleavage/methylation domain-containing protein